jgi:hypothetical protein
LALFAFSSANAQTQEGKLVDRLLRPNTALQNPSQNKKFAAARALSQKQARVGMFYLPQKSNTRAFSQKRSFSSWQFNSQKFNAAPRANSGTTASRKFRTGVYLTSPSQMGAPAPGAEKTAASGDFSGNRPFLERGKSQNSLDRQNPPMTIEQVRELLNKNK